MVQALFDETGTPVKYRIVQSAHPLLDEAAARAIMENEFIPAMQDGEPVEDRVSVPFNFTLND